MELRERITPASALGITHVFSTLDDQELIPYIDARLFEIGKDRAWLAELSSHYRASASAYGSASLEYGIELSDLLSWICSPFKGKSKWIFLNDAIYSYSASFAQETGMEMQQPLVLNCWVTGVSNHEFERGYPLALNTNYLDLNIRLAYENLMRHVQNHDWENGGEEIDSTSLPIRIAGIVNSLAADKDLRQAVTSLTSKLKGTIPSSDDATFRNSSWISDLIDTRNVVAHIGTSTTGLTLQDAWDRTRDINNIRQIVRLTTYFITDSIREQFLNMDAKSAKAWSERIEQEIGWM